MSINDRVVIVGGGLGGLAASCVLAARGYSVLLLERSEWAGGKAAVLSQDGFRFDMGPTILTLPSVLRRIFAEAGLVLERELDLVRLDPQWRCFFEGGDQLDLHEKTEEMLAALGRFSGQESVKRGYQNFLASSEQLHRVSDKYFFWKSIGGLRDMFDPSNSFSLKTLRDVLSLKMGRSVAGAIRSAVPDPRVAQMLDHFTQYVGSAPDQSPAVLCGIAHMQTDEGIWYPRGGTRAVPEALVKLAQRLGVEVRLNCGVKRILTAAGAVVGIETDQGDLLPARVVISNSDSVRTHRELIGGAASKAFNSRRSYEPACSGVVLYLGLKKKYEHLLHHNFVFSTDPHQEFESIYRKGEPAPDPTCYVCAPSMTEPDVAPPGGEALYVLVHTPYLREGHDWEKMFPAYRRVILDKLKRCAGMPDIESRIVTESALTPADIHRRYHVLNGAIYGLASHGRFLGAFKPANRSPDLKGLYLAGGSAHPGPGMPMALMSGWIAADTVAKDRLVEPSARSGSSKVSKAIPAEEFAGDLS